MYTCDAGVLSCGKSFRLPFSVKQHERDKHGYSTDLDTKCSYCGRVLKTGMGCLNHKWDKHENPERIDTVKKKKTRGTRNKKKTKKTANESIFEKFQDLHFDLNSKNFSPLRSRVLDPTVEYAKYMPSITKNWSQKTANDCLFERFQDKNFDLNSYIDDSLIAKKEFITNAGTAVDTLVKFLEGTLYVAKIIKGGSLGKGTALHQKSDIDLVVFSNDFQNMEDFHSNLESYLEDLEDCIKGFSPHRGHEVIVEGKSIHGVQLKMKPKGYDHFFDVDVLPAFDNLTHNDDESNRDSSKAKQKTFIQIGREKDTAKRENYSSSLTELQRDFVQKQTPSVKRLIVFAKHWIKIQKGTSSFLTELMTIHAWEQARKPKSFDIKQGFYGFLQTLTNYRRLRVSWCPIDGIPTPTFTSSPVVVDPANPYNNVCNRTKDEDWSRIAEEAQKYMDSPFFEGFIGW